MHIDLKHGSGKSLSLQLFQALSDRIQSGLIEPGTKLPSVRSLSSSLKVSVVTVSKAYSQLESAGLIRCAQGKGCFVAHRPREHAKSQLTDSHSWQMALVDYLPRAQLWRYFNGSSVRYQFHLASIQPELLPSEEIGKNMHRLVTNDPSLIANYGPFQGDYGLRETLGEYFRERDIQVKAENLLITSGAQQGIDLVARTFVGAGDVVYMEAPTYTGAIDVFTSRGAKIITVPMDQDGMRVDMLTKLCDVHPPKIIYTVPTFHNPTGITMSASRRRSLLELAQSYHCLIVEDDPFSDLHFSKIPPRSIKSLDRTGHVIYIKSFSKMLSPGCRIACIAADGSILNRLVAAKTITDLGSPLLTQKAVQSFISSKRFEQYVNGMRNVLQYRCQIVTELLRQHCPEPVSWIPAEGGLSLWVTLPSRVNTNDLFAMAQNESLAILPGSVCYAAEPEFRHIRLCFSYMNESGLKEGVIRLCRIIAAYLTDQVISEQTPIM